MWVWVWVWVWVWARDCDCDCDWQGRATAAPLRLTNLATPTTAGGGIPAGKFYQFRFVHHSATEGSVPVSSLGFKPPKNFDMLNSHQHRWALRVLVSLHTAVNAF